MRAEQGLGMLDKVEKLYDAAGFGEIIKPDDLVAIKLHFGERGNTGYIRPQFVRRVVDKVKKSGGNPFLTDANTLYKGSRSNSVDHLHTAIENGFAYSVMGAPLIIADGLTGKEFVTVPINRKRFSEVKIGAAAHHADALITVTHFKGHGLTGFGGVLKNLGMGLGSRSGKMQMHSDLKPNINQEKCTACAKCTNWCPADAITMTPDAAKIDHEICIGCGECTVTCTTEAVEIDWVSTADSIQEKIVEYAEGALLSKKGKCGFMTFLTQVTPDCDCWGYSDAPVVRDIGILASLDPIALEQASVDLVNKESVLNGCCLSGKDNVEDKFKALYPEVNWERQLEYAVELGLGIREYQLISC